MSKIVLLMVEGVGPICGEEVENVDPATATTNVVLKRPVMVGIVPGRTERDKGQLGFNPYLEFSEEFNTGITFQGARIIHSLTPLDQVEQAYRANYTDSGLVLPPQGGLHRV